MADLTRLSAVAVAAAYDFTPFRAVVVGCRGGNGTLMIVILIANPRLRGMLLDQPAAVERTKKQLEANGLSERCQVVAQDFFKEVPGSGDAYLLKQNIHDWDDESAVKILKNCRCAMGAQSKLLIIAGVYPARIDQSAMSRGAAANDVNMLVATGGRQRSEAEFRPLFEGAGLGLTRIVPTATAISVTEGVPI